MSHTGGSNSGQKPVIRGKRTIIRRRDGAVTKRIEVGVEGRIQKLHNLEADIEDRSIEARVRMAATRMDESTKGSRVVDSAMRLRTEQVAVFEDIARFMSDCVTYDSTASMERRNYGRIIQPPRTGKTVIIGETIAGSGATAVVIVPTTTLVDQAAADLQRHLPTIRVGVYYGEEKRIVHHGVIVTTYAIMQLRHKEDAVPKCIKDATIVFLDEAHHSMSNERQEMIEQAFHASAIRIALTATPDYDEQRALARFFPTLIHEITLQEAVELDLLADLKVWVVEVDADASSVRLVAGDFDSEELGRIMSTAPFFEAARIFRYTTEENERSPALICCRTRQQAYDCHKYFLEHKPEGSKAPGLILQETTRDKRRELLLKFERGTIDTLINVRVLTEGWNSPHCSLLIDMDPSQSFVRSKQKFFRPMTKTAGGKKARIYMLIPARLPGIPIFPQDLFGASIEIHGFEELEVKLKSQAAKQAEKAIKRRGKTAVEEVEVATRVLLEAGTGRHKLNPRDLEQIREVIASGIKVDKWLPQFSSFRRLTFQHDLFTGRGEQLLRYCGYVPSNKEYAQFMRRLFPGISADMLIMRSGRAPMSDSSCAEDVAFMRSVEISEKPLSETRARNFESGWIALCGGEEEQETPEELVTKKEEWEITMACISSSRLMRPISQQTICLYYGLLDDDPKGLQEIETIFEQSGLSKYYNRSERCLEHAHLSLRNVMRALSLKYITKRELLDRLDQNAEYDDNQDIANLIWCR
ncbi:MAG: DEAD/DEAH box helicase family protein [Candidatus Uhrbacteria bacterium]|nr:DEAD/DEAH box helicase family protein [Candidatus Uhrbacteria bacterium]